MDVPFPAGNETSVLVAGGRVRVCAALSYAGCCAQLSSGRVPRRRGVGGTSTSGWEARCVELMWLLTVLAQHGAYLCGWTRLFAEDVSLWREAWNRCCGARRVRWVRCAFLPLRSDCAITDRGWCIREQVSRLQRCQLCAETVTRQVVTFRCLPRCDRHTADFHRAR